MSNVILVQTVIKPHFVYEQREDSLHYFDNFQEFYSTMADLEINKQTIIAVNRGPGSYSGIRVGMAYAYGLLHGNTISKENLRFFTSFDILSTLAEHTDVFLKAWPRINGLFEQIKGYFYKKADGSITYTELQKLSQDTTIILEEGDAYENAFGAPLIHLGEKLKKESICEFVDHVTGFPRTGDPLYINPVHINS